MLESLLAAAAELIGDNCFAEVAVPELARGAGVTYTTVSRRWDELQGPFSRIRAERLLKQIGPADISEAEDLAAWTASLSTALLTVKPDLPMCFLAALDQALRAELAFATAFVTGELDVDAVMDRLIAPIVFRRLAAQKEDMDPLIRAVIRSIYLDARSTPGSSGSR